MSHFVLKSKKKLSELSINDRVEESCFATLDNGLFYQFEYIETEEEAKKDPYIVKPGIFSIEKTMTGLTLYPTKFTKDKLLEDLVETKHVEEKVDCFFTRLEVYKKLNIEVPKRAALLYGRPGTGKTALVNKICEKYNQAGTTAIVVWPTNVIESYDVKEFIKTFEYKGVDKLILVAEDVGGIEMENVRVRSDPSLLSLLDNKEKTFSIPVFILATTNHPEMFLENLGNRPDRFDDKIEVGFPSKEARLKLLEFFAISEIPEETKVLLGTKECSRFSPAHIREVVIRSAIYDKNMTDVVKEMLKEIKSYDDAFAKKMKSSIGLGGSYDD